MLYDKSDISSFYTNVIELLGLKVSKLGNALYVYSSNLKIKDYNLKITQDDLNYMQFLLFIQSNDKKYKIPFHPLNTQKKSYNRLIIDYSIHFYLEKLFRSLSFGIIRIKDGIGTNYRSYKFNSNQLDILETPTAHTIYKFNNLFKVITATSFSKNLISFEIDFNSEQEAKVNFKYPLYEMLKTIQNNTIFGIHLEDAEIKLFKQIYEIYIINIIDDLFKNCIKVSDKSSEYPEFYLLMKTKLMLEETYWKQYNICFINCKRMLPKYNDMLSNLNKYKHYTGDYKDEEQKIDQEAYKNELQIRKESEPNWLLLKDDKMGKNKHQPAVIENNDIRQTMDRFGHLIEYDAKQYQNKIRKFNADILVQEYRDNYQKFKNNQEWKEIFYWQNMVLGILRNNGGDLWFDTRIKKYCFRSKLNASIAYVDSNELGDLLTRALKDKIKDYLNQNENILFSNHAIEIVFVSKLKGVNKHILNTNEKADNAIKILIFENEILTIDDDIFDVNNQNEFFKNDSDFFYTRNRFVPNEYLKKRDQQVPYNNEQTFIEKFIYHLAKENQKLSDYIMNWLAYYFQNLQKSKTALVLLGEKEVTKNIFWNIIIKEIFSKQCCITLDDKECDTALVSDIAKDKLFFHIGDIDTADTKFDDKTLALIIKDLLIRPSVTTDANEEIDIHGQILVTAANPAPYLKKVLSKCTVIEVNNIDNIMEKLDVEDEAEFEDAIYSDLDNFTGKLANYNVISENAECRIDTEARETLKGDKSSNVDKDEIEQNIDDFIKAIKDKDINYFKKVEVTKDKNGNDIYEQLKYAFHKGYFISQDLYLYYNAINELPVKTNKLLTDRLKVKDEMFKQEVKTLKILTKDGEEKVLFKSYTTPKETGTKELYKIDAYIQAKDINIPDRATVTTSQSESKIREFTFSSEDEEEKCIQRTKKYSDKKKKEKEQK